MEVQALYQRQLAVEYAHQHVFNPNPYFANMDVSGGGGDCTNFTSQCLLMGGFVMDYRQTGYDTEWWYRHIGNAPFDADEDDWWSCTWSIPELFFRYLRINQGTPLNLLARPSRARTLRRGDLIFYDWDGDGLFNHSAIVTKFVDGWPYVTYRTLQPLQPIKDAYWRLRFRGAAEAIYGMALPDSPSVFTKAPVWSELSPCESNRANASQDLQEK